jgi:hypothetical protein
MAKAIRLISWLKKVASMAKAIRLISYLYA